MSKYTEINVAQPLKFEHRMKVNDLVGLRNQKSIVYSEGIEIFPGVNVQFLLSFYENNGFRVFVNGVGPWTEVDRGESDLGFAGKYELDINTQIISFKINSTYITDNFFDDLLLLRTYAYPSWVT